MEQEEKNHLLYDAGNLINEVLYKVSFLRDLFSPETWGEERTLSADGLNHMGRMLQEMASELKKSNETLSKYHELVENEATA